MQMILQLQDMMLSHHDDEHLDRCVRVAGRHVCRRCIVLYPIAFAVMALQFADLVSLPLWVLFVLPVAAAAEFVAEMIGVIRYSPQRQVAVTAIAAPALGLGFVRVLTNMADGPFWKMTVAFAVPCAIAAMYRGARDAKKGEAARVAHEESHPLLKGFASKAEFEQYLAAATVQEDLRAPLNAESS